MAFAIYVLYLLCIAFRVNAEMGPEAEMEVSETEVGPASQQLRDQQHMKDQSMESKRMSKSGGGQYHAPAETAAIEAEMRSKLGYPHYGSGLWRRFYEPWYNPKTGKNERYVYGWGDIKMFDEMRTDCEWYGRSPACGQNHCSAGTYMQQFQYWVHDQSHKHTTREASGSKFWNTFGKSCWWSGAKEWCCPNKLGDTSVHTVPLTTSWELDKNEWEPTWSKSNANPSYTVQAEISNAVLSKSDVEKVPTRSEVLCEKCADVRKSKKELPAEDRAQFVAKCAEMEKDNSCESDIYKGAVAMAEQGSSSHHTFTLLTCALAAVGLSSTVYYTYNKLFKKKVGDRAYHSTQCDDL